MALISVSAGGRAKTAMPVPRRARAHRAAMAASGTKASRPSSVVQRLSAPASSAMAAKSRVSCSVRLSPLKSTPHFHFFLAMASFSAQRGSARRAAVAASST